MSTAAERQNARLPLALDQLRGRSFAHGILSAYLDIAPARAIGGGHLIAFRDACDHIRGQFDEADATDRRQFETAAAAAELCLVDVAVTGGPGLAIFATGDGAPPLVIELPARTGDQVRWDTIPAIDPLETTLDEFERIGVVLFDKERSRLFVINLGEIEDQHVLIDDVPGKQATGDWFGLSQKRYERHHEDHVLRHAKRTIRALMEQLKSRPFDRLLIGGPEEAVVLLTDHLPRPLRDRLAGSLSIELFASDADVLAAALDEAARIERRKEIEAIDQLVEEESSRFVALGTQPVLAALNEHRVNRLFIADQLTGDGYECTVCERLTLEQGRCQSCFSETEPITDLREHVIRQALEQGSRLEFVSGLASEALMRYGGLGARTRY